MLIAALRAAAVAAHPPALALRSVSTLAWPVAADRDAFGARYALLVRIVMLRAPRHGRRRGRGRGRRRQAQAAAVAARAGVGGRGRRRRGARRWRGRARRGRRGAGSRRRGCAGTWPTASIAHAAYVRFHACRGGSISTCACFAWPRMAAAMRAGARLASCTAALAGGAASESRT